MKQTFVCATLWLLYWIPLMHAIPETISFKTSVTKLPVPLYDHIISSYNDQLFMIGGYTANNTENNDIYSTQTALLHKTSNFTQTQTSPDLLYPYHIECSFRCSATINDSVYIFQTDPIRSDLYKMLIYNMSSHSFIPSNTYYGEIASELLGNSTFNTLNSWDFWLPDNGELYNGCIGFDDNYIWILSATKDGYLMIGSMSGTSFNSVTYSIADNMWFWSSFASDLKLEAMGCAVVDGILYSFGGRILSNQQEVGYIQICTTPNIPQYIGFCSTQLEQLQYDRSDLYVQVTQSKQFLIIYGGTTFAAQRNIEIFDIFGGKMYPAIFTEDLMIHNFGSIILNDILMIIGGINGPIIGGLNETEYVLDDIKYVTMTKLFETEYIVPNFSCVTSYNADSKLVPVDKYLFGNDEKTLIFDVIGYFKVETYPANWVYLSFTFARQTQSIANIRLDGQDVRSGDNVKYVTNRRLNMQNISIDTEIDMMSNHSSFWLTWKADVDENGDPITLTFWKLGVGHVVNEYNVLSYPAQSNDDLYDEGFFQTPFISGFDNITLLYGKYMFYTDSCSLQLSMSFTVSRLWNFTESGYGNLTNFDNFNVGDRLNINWTLSEATSLLVPIIFESDTIGSIHHKMFVNEDGCNLCSNGSEQCYLCADGILIDDLRTYNIDQNEYEIYVSSPLDGLTVLPNNPLPLTRAVMEVEILFDFDGIYPGAELYIIPIINYQNGISQSDGTIQLTFDADFGFDDNEAQILIDFYTDSCIVTYDNDSIDCLDAILIPHEMAIQPISQNEYFIQIQSFDIKLVGNVSFILQREIQTVWVDVTDSVYLGQNIEFIAGAIGNISYQLSSEITINNPQYQVSSIIYLTYTNISECDIETFITGWTTGCDEGIKFHTEDGYDAVSQYIHLSLISSDSYLQDSEFDVLIADCPMGQGITSGSCTDCALGQVGADRNSVCIDCNGIAGIECFGSSNLQIRYNYWTQIQANNIISAFCPSSVCCRVESGCNHTNALDLCAVNRNNSVPLCGSCNDGFAEVFGSAMCRECDDNYLYLLFPFLVSAFLVLIMVIVDAPSATTTNKETDLKKTMAKDDIQALQICFLRPFTYFFQGINFVTVQTGFWFYLSPLMTFFAFDFLSESNSESGICFLGHLTSMQLELWYLFVPFCMFLCLAMYRLINFIVQKVCKKPLRWLVFGWNVVWSLILIMVGNVISTMLNIIACSRIGDELVHFHGGYLQCMGGLWYMAFFVLIAIIIFWFIVWILLKKMSAIERDSRQSYLRTITKPYKLKYWYWEIVLISRRILLTFFVTFQYISYDLIQYSLLMILVIYLVLQVQFKPFKHDRANYMDIMCMFLLIVSLTTVVFQLHLNYPTVVSFIMTMVIGLPILLLSVYTIYAIIRYIGKKNYRQKSIQKIKLHLTKSQRRGMFGKGSVSLVDYENDTEDEEDKVEVGIYSAVDITGDHEEEIKDEEQVQLAELDKDLIDEDEDEDEENTTTPNMTVMKSVRL